jgi:hypothetical protein
VGKTAFPKMLKNTLKYVENWSASTNANGFAYVQWNVNGLFDPQAALGGHQPLYFDTMTSIYNEYHVVASRIKITPCYTDITAATSFTLSFAAYVDDDTTPALSFTSAAERPGAKTTIENWAGQGFFAPKSMYLNWNASAYFGPNILQNNDLGGTVTANPVEAMYFTAVCDGGTPFGAHVIGFMVEIEYDTVWTELKTISQS